MLADCPLLPSGLRVLATVIHGMCMYLSHPQDATSFSSLGHMLAHGLGVPQDYLIARGYYERGMKAGEAASLNGLGYLYFYGLGVPVNVAYGVDLIKRAADAGHADALYNLGIMRLKVCGVAWVWLCLHSPASDWVCLM